MYAIPSRDMLDVGILFRAVKRFFAEAKKELRKHRNGG
jgi:hypothetical protein